MLWNFPLFAPEQREANNNVEQSVLWKEALGHNEETIQLSNQRPNTLLNLSLINHFFKQMLIEYDVLAREYQEAQVY